MLKKRKRFQMQNTAPFKCTKAISYAFQSIFFILRCDNEGLVVILSVLHYSTCGKRAQLLLIFS